MTLISGAGTIGKMAYARRDMEGSWSNHDILKVVPNTEKVSSGYLYAFLSSDFGVPLVTAGTFGGIILISNHPICGIQVPRFGQQLKNEVDSLINRASRMRTQAVQLINDSRARFDSFGEGVLLDRPEYPIISAVSSRDIIGRLEAAYHDPAAETIAARITHGRYELVKDLCKEVSLPGIFKRIYIEDVEYGAPYFTGGAIFWLERYTKKYCPEILPCLMMFKSETERF